MSDNAMSAAFEQAGVSASDLVGDVVGDLTVAQDDLTPPPFLQKNKPTATATTTATVVPPPLPTATPEAVTPEVKAEAPQEAPKDAESNQPTNDVIDRSTVIRTVTKLGENEAAGANARPSFYVKVTEAARGGAVGEDDAKPLYDAYVKGIGKAKGMSQPNLGSEAAQVSKVKTMLKLGLLPNIDGRLTAYNVVHTYKDFVKNGVTPGKSVADCLLTAARMQLGQGDELLSPDQLKAACSKKVADPKIVADILDKVLKAATSAMDNDEVPLGDEIKEELVEIGATLQTRINELGGTTKMKRELEKQQRKVDEAQAKATALKAIVDRSPLPGGVARY